MAINCNFARTAIYHFTSKFMTKRNKIPCGSMIHTVREYNTTHFNETPNLTKPRNFSNHWHPSETKHLYLSTFSISEWNTLAPEEKTNHTLRDCQVCQTKYQHLKHGFSRDTQEATDTPSNHIISRRLLNTTTIWIKIAY